MLIAFSVYVQQWDIQKTMFFIQNVSDLSFGAVQMSFDKKVYGVDTFPEITQFKFSAGENDVIFFTRMAILIYEFFEKGLIFFKDNAQF